jgi:hypothetical protein
MRAALGRIHELNHAVVRGWIGAAPLAPAQVEPDHRGHRERQLLREGGAGGLDKAALAMRAARPMPGMAR